MAALVAAVAVHLGLILALVSTPEHRSPATTSEPPPPILFFIDEHPSPSEEPHLAPRKPVLRRFGSFESSPEVFPVETPPSVAPDEAPKQIDWRLEAERAAARQIDEQERGSHSNTALVHRADGVKPLVPPAAQPPNGFWDPTRVQRVQPLETGGLLVHVNDRCAIAVIGLAILPGCKLGKIEARGNLFEHMDEAPQLGNWKDR